MSARADDPVIDFYTSKSFAEIRRLAETSAGLVAFLESLGYAHRQVSKATVYRLRLIVGERLFITLTTPHVRNDGKSA
jgi:hypothetical protein